MSFYIIVLLTVVVGVYCAGEDERDARDELIVYYFMQGYNLLEILRFLLLSHHISLSVRQLRRILTRRGLHRNNHQSDVEDIIRAIDDMISRRGLQGLGYRPVWRCLNTLYGLRATQWTVIRILRVLDPAGINSRRHRRLRRRTYTNKGPNYLIHIDGNDKLKPFGIAIHGAIDGYSRRILWLKAGRSNNDPRYIGRLYLDMVLETMRVPRSIRSDMGTENTIVRDVHLALRSAHRDVLQGIPPFLSGRSTANQRIEMFWGFLNRGILYFWRNIFRDLRDSGLMNNADAVHIECVRFCFMAAIQSHLDVYRRLWNGHRLRSQRDTECVTGIPDVLYFTPELESTIDYSLPVTFDEHEIRHLAEGYTLEYPKFGCNGLFLQVVELLSGVDQDSFVQPKTPTEAILLYSSIVNQLPAYD